MKEPEIKKWRECWYCAALKKGRKPACTLQKKIDETGGEPVITGCEHWVFDKDMVGKRDRRKIKPGSYIVLVPGKNHYWTVTGALRGKIAVKRQGATGFIERVLEARRAVKKRIVYFEIEYEID